MHEPKDEVREFMESIRKERERRLERDFWISLLWVGLLCCAAFGVMVWLTTL
jgi:hypothetical protein